MYPCIQTIQHPTIFTKAFAANFTKPYSQNRSRKSNLVLQYADELQVYEINHDLLENEDEIMQDLENPNANEVSYKHGYMHDIEKLCKK